MRNPLANEDAAFRFVLGTIAYLAPIVLASWIATWLGVVVFVVATVVAVVVLRGGRTSSPAAPGTVERAAVTDTWRILVIANETLGSPRLRGGRRSHRGPCGGGRSRRLPGHLSAIAHPEGPTRSACARPSPP